MASFRCYDNSDVIATLIMTNFHLNTTVVAIFPNASLWRHSLYSILVLTLKTNCIKPSSYASTAYVVVMRPSFLSDSFVKIWATCEIFLGKWFTAPPPPGKKFPVRLQGRIQDFFRRGCTRLLPYFNTNKPHSFFLQNTSCIRKPQVISRGGEGCAPPAPSP